MEPNSKQTPTEIKQNKTKTMCNDFELECLLNGSLIQNKWQRLGDADRLKGSFERTGNR